VGDSVVVDEEEEDNQPVSSMYSSSPLLERADMRAPQERCVSWRSKTANCRHRRFKKACWFTFALVACLWLMLPALIHGDKVLFEYPYVHAYANHPLAGRCTGSTLAPQTLRKAGRFAHPGLANTTSGVQTTRDITDHIWHLSTI